MSRHHRDRALQLVATALLLAPLGSFFLLRQRPDLDRVYEIPVEHFYMVSLTSLTALTLAIIVGIAAVRSRAPRTFFVTIGFLAVAGIFSVHGLMTPGEKMILSQSHNAIAISARLSLLVGGLCFLLSTLKLPTGVDRFIAQHHRRLFGVSVLLVASYIAANLLHPALLDVIPTGQSPAPPAPSKVAQPAPSGMGDMYGYGSAPAATTNADTPADSLVGIDGNTLNYAMAIAAGSLLLFAAWRYARIYDLSHLPATGAWAAGMLLLAESQVSMTFGVRWYLSWWLYHVMMLFGFLIPIAAIGWAYLRGNSLNQIVEGLFLRDMLAKIERSFPEAMDEMVAATVAKDGYLEGHSRRVCELTVAIGEQLGLSYGSIRAASYGALLHDIGKIGIPRSILLKTGKLTDDEFEVMKSHPVRGWSLLSRAPSLREAAPAIRWHHERLDGSGYPDRLDADQIPLEARIVAVADVWDALTSNRVYRDAWNPSAARQLLEREAGETLDAQCVNALFAVLDHQTARTLSPYSTIESEMSEMLAS
jgi:HD-GYP domain-containing protein (c-di-GMP phosphodiesterase class II)